ITRKFDLLKSVASLKLCQSIVVVAMVNVFAVQEVGSPSRRRQFDCLGDHGIGWTLVLIGGLRQNLHDASKLAGIDNFHETNQFVAAIGGDKLVAVSKRAVFAFYGFEILSIMPKPSTLTNGYFIIDADNASNEFVTKRNFGYNSAALGCKADVPARLLRKSVPPSLTPGQRNCGCVIPVYRVIVVPVDVWNTLSKRKDVGADAPSSDFSHELLWMLNGYTFKIVFVLDHCYLQISTNDDHVDSANADLRHGRLSTPYTYLSSSISHA